MVISKSLSFKVKSTLILFDRYVQDVSLNPIRFRLKLKRRFLKIPEFFTPNLDVNFFLIANPKTIYLRKKELKISEIKYQLDQLKNFSNKKNCFIIDTENNIDENIILIKNIIFKKLNERH